MSAAVEKVEKKELSLAERRARLERRANVIRSRLLRTIDAIDTRRHQVTEITHHAKRIAKPAMITALGIGAVALGAGLAIRSFITSRREKTLEYKVSNAIARLTQPKPPPLANELFRRLTLTLVTIGATELAKRTITGFADGRFVLGAGAVGEAKRLAK